MDDQHVRISEVCQSYKTSVQEVSVTLTCNNLYKPVLTEGLVDTIIVSNTAAIHLAITMAAVTMEIIITVEVVVGAVGHLIGGTKLLTVTTLEPDCFIFCIFLCSSVL